MVYLEANSRTLLASKQFQWLRPFALAIQSTATVFPSLDGRNPEESDGRNPEHRYSSLLETSVLITTFNQYYTFGAAHRFRWGILLIFPISSLKEYFRTPFVAPYHGLLLMLSFLCAQYLYKYGAAANEGQAGAGSHISAVLGAPLDYLSSLSFPVLPERKRTKLIHYV